MSYFHLAIAFAGAVFYYKGAQHENISPIPWVALSIAMSALVMWLAGSIIVMVMGQLVLVPAIALWRVLREDRKRDDG